MLDSYGIGHGDWAVAPPARIPAGGVGRFWLKDPKPSVHGSEGWARYTYRDASGSNRSVRFDFADPTGVASNDARTSSSAFTFFTRSGHVDGPWSTRNRVVTGGHPFYVAYVWGYAPLPSDA